MRIAIYSRKSKYTGKGDSIANQEKLCKDYVQSRFPGSHEFSVFEDEGFSGKNTDRPEFKKMLKQIESNKFDALICYRLDRISRNVSDFSSTLEILQEHNVSFISITENFDTSSSMGRAMIYIASIFAQLERETIAERVKDNMAELAKKGKWSGGKLPAGYKSEAVVTIDENGNERKSTRLVQVKEDVALVKLIYDVYLKERSLHKTEIYFTQHNIKSTHGIRLEKTSLKYILQNPIYVKSSKEVIDYMIEDGWTVYGEPDGVHGLMSYNKTRSATKKGKSTKLVNDKSEWFAAVGAVEGFIEPSTWIKVQEQFKANKDTFPALGKTHNALLTGKIFCGNCNEYMLIQHGRASKVTGNKTFYYSCSLKKKSKSKLCRNSNARSDMVDELVIKSLATLGINRSKLIESLKKSLKNKSSSDLATQKKALTKELEAKKKQIDNLMNKIAVSEDSGIEDIFIEKIKSLKTECIEIENKIVNIKEMDKKSKESLVTIDVLINTLDKCAIVEQLDRAKQKKIIDLLIDKIYWYGDGNNKGGKIKIKFYDELSNESESLEYTLEELKIKMSQFSSHSFTSMFKNTTFKNPFTEIEQSTYSLYNNMSEGCLGFKIKKIRHQLGMSQKEFSKFCGIGYSSLCKYESGKYNISKENQEKIYNKLDIYLGDS